MILVHNSRDKSNDLNSILRPRDQIVKIAEEMSDELDLPKEWLNADFQGFVGDNFPVEDVANLGNLLVRTGTTEWK